MTDEELALACADQKVVHLRCDCSHDETDQESLTLRPRAFAHAMTSDLRHTLPIASTTTGGGKVG